MTTAALTAIIVGMGPCYILMMVLSLPDVVVIAFTSVFGQAEIDEGFGALQKLLNPKPDAGGVARLIHRERSIGSALQGDELRLVRTCPRHCA